MKFVQIQATNPDEMPRMCWSADHLLILEEQTLRVCTIELTTHIPVLTIENVASILHNPGSFVVLHMDMGVTTFMYSPKRRWQEKIHVQGETIQQLLGVSSVEMCQSSFCSPCGRYLIVTGNLLAVQEDDPTQPAVGFVLLDLLQRTELLRMRCSMGHPRPGFLSEGGETHGLLVAAESYMDVHHIALPTGEIEHAFIAQTGWDFCHTDFVRVQGLLWTYGCVWACPYESRVYDFRPWTRKESFVPAEVHDEFPLEFMLVHEERWYDDIVLTFHPREDDGESLLYFNYVQLEEILEMDEEDRDICIEYDGWRGRKNYEALLSLREQGVMAAIVMYRYDVSAVQEGASRDDALVESCVLPAFKTSETNMARLPGMRLLGVDSECFFVCDGETRQTREVLRHDCGGVPRFCVSGDGTWVAWCAPLASG